MNPPSLLVLISTEFFFITIHYFISRLTRKSNDLKANIFPSIPFLATGIHTKEIPMFPQCASYRPTEIVESVRRDESRLWWRQTSPRICLTACQRFLLLSILICSVNNGGNEEGSLAASSTESSMVRKGGRIVSLLIRSSKSTSNETSSMIRGFPL